MGQHPRILRKRTDRLHALGAGWWQQRNDQRRLGKNREGSWDNHLSAGACMAVASIRSNAADSRHVIARASGGKYGGVQNTVGRRRVENNRRTCERSVRRLITRLQTARQAATLWISSRTWRFG